MIHRGKCPYFKYFFFSNDLLEIFIALSALSKHSDSNWLLSECCVLLVIGIIKQLLPGNDTVS